MIHVYAFADGLRGLPRIDGLDGAPLEEVSVGGVSTVFSRRHSVRETQREDAIVHGLVVGALERAADVVVPVRYGQEVRDERALADAVDGNAEAIRAAFVRVRGCAEIAVRVWGARREAPQSVTGADYLRARRAAESQRRATVDSLHGRLFGLARDSRIRYGSLGDEELFVAAYLVPSSRLDEVSRAVEAFGSAHPDLTVVCTGPWPPFSFVDEVAG